MAVKKNAAADAAKVEKKDEEVKAAATEKKAAAKKETGDKVVLQYNGKDIEMKAVVEAAKADYKAKTKKTATNVVVYVKPEDNAAYYTVAGKGAEDFKVDL